MRPHSGQAGSLGGACCCCCCSYRSLSPFGVLLLPGAVCICVCVCSGGEPAAKRGPAASGPRFHMGSTSTPQPQELTREQQLADIEVREVCTADSAGRHVQHLPHRLSLSSHQPPGLPARLGVSCQTPGHRSRLLHSALSQCHSPWACCCCCVRVLQATFAAARGVPRHPNKPGVTARRVVPILPDVEAWPNKYVVVQFPEGDPAHDSRTLAKVRGVFLRFWRRTFLKESVRVAGEKPMQAATSGISTAAALAACVLPARAAPEPSGTGHPTAVTVYRLPPQIATADKRRELLSHSLLKSYQTQASAQGGSTDLTVGLLVPHVRRAVGSWLTCDEPGTRQGPTTAQRPAAGCRTSTLLTVAADRLRQSLFQRPWLPFSAAHTHTDTLTLCWCRRLCRVGVPLLLCCLVLTATGPG